MLPHPARCNPAADRSGCGEGHSHPREQRQREQSSGKQEEELKALRRLLLLLLLLRVPGRDPRPLRPQKRRARVCDHGCILVKSAICGRAVVGSADVEVSEEAVDSKRRR